MKRSALSNNRRAFTLMEMTVAISVMAILMIAVAQWTVASRRAETAIQERNVAIEAAENVVQRIALVPEEEWADQPWADWTLPEETQTSLPGGELQVAANEESETSMRFEVLVTWDGGTAGSPRRETSLTTWRFRPATSDADESVPETETEANANEATSSVEATPLVEETPERMEGDAENEN